MVSEEEIKRVLQGNPAISRMGPMGSKVAAMLLKLFAGLLEKERKDIAERVCKRVRSYVGSVDDLTIDEIEAIVEEECKVGA